MKSFFSSMVSLVPLQGGGELLPQMGEYLDQKNKIPDTLTLTRTPTLMRGPGASLEVGRGGRSSGRSSSTSRGAI